MEHFIQTIQDPKVGVYYEKDKPYMFLEANVRSLDGRLLKYNIPRIGLSEVTMEIEKNDQYCISIVKSKISFSVLSVNDVFATVTDITPYKEMTLAEIEKKLGHKVKIVGV